MPAELIKESVLKPKIAKLGIFALMSGIGAVLLGLAGTALATIGAILGLTSKSVVTALNNFKELKQLDHNQLTSQQKLVIKNFSQQLRKPTIYGMVENFRLEKLLTELVDAAVQTHPIIIKPLKNEPKEKREKMMRKIFTNYIKARRQKDLLQKVVDEYTAMNITGIDVFTKKLRLKNKKKKIQRLEASHPGLRSALEGAAQKYSQSEDKMLERIKDNLMEAVETKEFQREMRLLQQQPIVPL